MGMGEDRWKGGCITEGEWRGEELDNTTHNHGGRWCA